MTTFSHQLLPLGRAGFGNELRKLIALANKAQRSGDREKCIEIIERIYALCDEQES